ncbi:hypothetical protein Syun_011898 [Stephania yunnanensis]|uniref:Uncharacterized protein n=1 Tax=Stephania yunnanensis TaxID=152371 RepID=A0AAP0JYD7_9MAGN
MWGAAAAKRATMRGGENRSAAASPEENTAQWRAPPRSRSARRAASRGRQGLQMNDRAGESRSTSTMPVDDDDDGGGEACAATGIFDGDKFSIWVCRVEEDSRWLSVADMSQI